MKIRYIDIRDALARQAKQTATMRPSFGFCPKCGGAFYGRGVCRRCRKAAHIAKGQGVRHV